ncbi:MAG: transposase [Candidatus Dormibacteria bacterium]
MGGKTRVPYSPQFREEAVRLVKQHGRKLSDVAGELGVSVESLRHWVQQIDVDQGRRDGLTTDERIELGRLRRRLRQTEEERDILKKALAFFAKDSDRTQ